MGYRSEVSLVVKRDIMANLYKNIPNEVNTMVGYADQFLHKENTFYLHWNHIKWYEEMYNEIGVFMKKIRSFDGDDYHFIRIGEDNDDIEDNGCYYDNPFDTGISRTIVSDTHNSKSVDISIFQ